MGASDGPSAGEARRMFASLYVYMALGAILALLLPVPPPVDRMFTAEELARFDGVQLPSRYLAILGSVYDVTEGEAYTEAGGYSFFVAKDGSRAFSTGEFEGRANDEISDLEDGAIKAIFDWKNFYDTHDKYFPVGKVIGRYYTKDGLPTAELRKVSEAVDRVGAKNDQLKAFDKEHPSCNTRWSKDEGSEVWCTDDMLKHRKPSSRLVPRLVFVPALGKERCSCIELKRAREEAARFKMYSQCSDTPDKALCKVGKT